MMDGHRLDTLRARINLSGIDPYKRVQTGWRMYDAWPTRKGECACGCGQPLSGRRTRWAEDKHGADAYAIYRIYAGHSRAIRYALWKRDGDVCAECGTRHRQHSFPATWEADHITEVVNGGGGCWLDNYQTLCVEPCHKAKTAALARERANPSHPDQLELSA